MTAVTAEVGLDVTTGKFSEAKRSRVVDEWIGLSSSEDGELVLVLHNKTVMLRRLPDLRVVRTVYVFDDEQGRPDIELSPTGRFSLIGIEDAAAAVLIDNHTGIRIHTFRHRARGKNQVIYSLRFSRDERLVLTVCGADEEIDEVKVWDRKSGRLARLLSRAGDDELTAGALSPDGKLIVTGGWKLRVWDVATGRMVREFPKQRQERPFYAFRISPDGKYVLTYAQITALWNLHTGELVRELK